MTDVTSERNRDSRVRCFACPDALTGLRVFRARCYAFERNLNLVTLKFVVRR